MKKDKRNSNSNVDKKIRFQQRRKEKGECAICTYYKRCKIRNERKADCMC